MVEKTLAFRQRRAADIRGGRYLRRVRQLLSRGWAPRGGDRFGPAQGPEDLL